MFSLFRQEKRIGTIGISHDLTFNVLENLPISVCAVDMRPDKLDIFYANKSFIKTMGAKKSEDLIGKPIFSTFHPIQSNDRTADDIVPEFVANLQEKGWHQDEVNYARIDGSSFTVRVHCIVLMNDGIPYAIAQMEDVATAISAQEKKLSRDALAAQFETNVGQIVDDVEISARQLQMIAADLSKSTDKATNLSKETSSVAENVRSNVMIVSSAAEELRASIDEIARQVDGSALIARSAVAEATQTADLVDQLKTATSRIDDVVGMIATIASQTNLLALNATIEAARAGDAGRGFAVVASEVKALAGQTAKATVEITRQIQAIQTITSATVSAIDGIITRIQEISSNTTTIAAAIEEQGAATGEIAANVVRAATGTREVSTSISGVSDVTIETNTAATFVLNSASELSHRSTRLSEEVVQFLKTVRSA